MAIKIASKDFFSHRGVNDQLQTLKRIEDDHLVELTNFNYVPSAENKVHLQQREGTVADLDTELVTGTNIQGLEFTNFNEGNEITVAWEDKIGYLSGSEAIPLMSGATKAKYDFELFENKLIIANGTDALRERAKGAVPSNLGGSPPIGKYLHKWHSFLFVAGISAQLNRLQWSDISDKDTWPAGNIQDWAYGPITGIGSVQDVMYVFFNKFIATVTGYSTSTFNFGQLSDGIGCVSHYGIVSNGSTLFFPASDGIYAIGQLGSSANTVGGSSLIKLSPQKISNFWSDLDLSDPEYIHSVHDPERHCVRWTFRRDGQATNDRELFYDYHENVLGFGFTKGRSFFCYALCKINEEWVVKAGGDGVSQIFTLSNSSKTDNGNTIEGCIITKAYDYDYPDISKMWQRINILAKGQSNEVPVRVHYGVGDFPSYQYSKEFTTRSLPVWDTAIWDTDVWSEDTFSEYAMAIRRLGKTLVVKITTLGASKGIDIAGWNIDAQPLKKKIGRSNI